MAGGYVLQYTNPVNERSWKQNHIEAFQPNYLLLLKAKSIWLCVAAKHGEMNPLLAAGMTPVHLVF